MPGLVFFRTAARDRVVTFYTDRLEFEPWLEQAAGCTILRRDNLLLGFCGADQSETEGTVTVAVDDEAAVDTLYGDLEDVADGPPTVNDAFDIYQFFATDPDGRTVEVQTFRHPVPSV